MIVVGTFLPWLRSGTVDRNSYAAGDALRRVEHLPAALGAVLDGWPFLSIVCAVAAALALLGLRRWAFALGALCAVVAGAVSAVVLVRGSGGLVRAASTGPAVTLTGAGLISVSVVISVAPVWFGRPTARPVGGTDDHS